MRVVLLLCLLACFIEAGKSRKKSRVERYAPDYANTYHNYSYFVQDLMEIANDPKNADILKICKSGEIF